MQSAVSGDVNTEEVRTRCREGTVQYSSPKDRSPEGRDDSVHTTINDLKEAGGAKPKLY